jgi:DNA repair protein RAD16
MSRLPLDKKGQRQAAHTANAISALLRRGLQDGLPSVRKGKGKGRGKFSTRHETPPVSDGDGVAEDIMMPEGDHDESAIEESDDSGSVFEVSDTDMEDDDENSTSGPRKSTVSQSNGDIEIEEAMINAAVGMSLLTARLDSLASGAGPSFIPSHAVEEFDATMSLGESELTSLEDEPLLGGKNAKSKQRTFQNTSTSGLMTMAELRRKKKEDRRLARADKLTVRAEEAALRRRLGRKLTTVR